MERSVRQSLGYTWPWAEDIPSYSPKGELQHIVVSSYLEEVCNSPSICRHASHINLKWKKVIKPIKLTISTCQWKVRLEKRIAINIAFAQVSRNSFLRNNSVGTTVNSIGRLLMDWTVENRMNESLMKHWLERVASQTISVNRILDSSDGLIASGINFRVSSEG